MNAKTSPPPQSPPSLNEVPAKIYVAFRALAYCRSLTDPHSLGLDGIRSQRSLTCLETGIESASLNLIRNYLNGEVLLGPLADLQQLGESDGNSDMGALEFVLGEAFAEKAGEENGDEGGEEEEGEKEEEA